MESFVEHGISWRLTIARNTERPGPLWALPHDEEDAAFTAGLYTVSRYDGVLVAVENDEARLNGPVDPNQIFAVTESATARCPRPVGPSTAYVEAFLEEWDGVHPVVGLHTNWDGYLEAGGLGSISAFRSDSLMIPFTSSNGTGRLADEDTIIMLAGTLSPQENAKAAATRGWFDARGVHVIYRHVSEEGNGCTLADYLTLNELGDYYNLEVEHGDAQTQQTLVDLPAEHLGLAGAP